MYGNSADSICSILGSICATARVVEWFSLLLFSFYKAYYVSVHAEVSNWDHRKAAFLSVVVMEVLSGFGWSALGFILRFHAYTRARFSSLLQELSNSLHLSCLETISNKALLCNPSFYWKETSADVLFNENNKVVIATTRRQGESGCRWF